ncbi:MAG: phospholipase A [Syntrophales bacterium]
MQIIERKIADEPFLSSLSLLTIFFLLHLLMPSSSNAAKNTDDLARCARIEDGAARLRCFDDLTGRKPPAPSESVLTKLWDLDPGNRKRAFVLTPYRPNYFLPVAYNSSPNRDSSLDFDPNAKAQYNEAKFQISVKAKVWQDVLNDTLQGVFEKDIGVKGIDIWFAYTQLSFWQLYNSAFSAPFRDTNYEPELLVNFRTDYEILGFKGRILNLGFNHQSNGRSRPLSRSWNRLVANVGLEKDNFNLLLKTWYRIPEDQQGDDNPDLTRYMGYGELWGTLYWEKQRFAAMLRNNLRPGDNLGAIQLDWSIPLSMIHESFSDKFSFYIQYFNGYGESLLDYNKSINRISAGFMIAEWN